jgi:hypothetical protein
MRYRWLRLVVAALAMLLPAAAQTVPELLKSLEEISGLRALKPVAQDRIRRADLKAFFAKRLKEAVRPEETQLTELSLKKLGLVPQNFDLARTTIDLLSEQAAAFYDYERRKLVMLEGSNGALEQMALVHELAHALADQHFRIGRFMKSGPHEDETMLARQAVVEGQAQWLMSEYMARQMGQSLLKSPGLVNLLSSAADATGQYPVYDQAPLYLRESLVFPYAAGMKFQQAVVVELGMEGFGRVFDQPPATSRQVLHPDLYLRGAAEVVELEAPDIPARKKQWKALVGGTMGEFDHQVLLKLYAPDEVALAAEWRGADYRIWEEKKTKQTALTYVSQWSSPAAAARYFAAYRRVLQGKWAGALTMEPGSETVMRGTGGGAPFEVRLEGNRVISLEGATGSTLKP